MASLLSPPPPPPAAAAKKCLGRKIEFCYGKRFLGHFWDTNPWVADPPPLPPCGLVPTRPPPPLWRGLELRGMMGPPKHRPLIMTRKDSPSGVAQVAERTSTEHQAPDVLSGLPRRTDPMNTAPTSSLVRLRDLGPHACRGCRCICAGGCPWGECTVAAAVAVGGGHSGRRCVRGAQGRAQPRPSQTKPKQGLCRRIQVPTLELYASGASVAGFGRVQ